MGLENLCRSQEEASFIESAFKTASEKMERIAKLEDALRQALVAMRLAKALPAVAAEYDFDPAIDAAAGALASR